MLGCTKCTRSCCLEAVTVDDSNYPRGPYVATPLRRIAAAVWQLYNTASVAWKLFLHTPRLAASSECICLFLSTEIGQSRSFPHLGRLLFLRTGFFVFYAWFNSQDGYPESEALRGGLNSFVASSTSALWGGSRRADDSLVARLVSSLVVLLLMRSRAFCTPWDVVQSDMRLQDAGNAAHARRRTSSCGGGRSIYVYMYIRVYTCIYVYICVYMYICVYVYICIYVYMYICIYVYTYICMLPPDVPTVSGLRKAFYSPISIEVWQDIRLFYV